MSEPFEYFSGTRLQYRDGARHAWLGEGPEPVVYGMQGARVGDDVVDVRSEGGGA